MRLWKPSTWLLAAGLAMWLVAQVLPAADSYFMEGDSGDPGASTSVPGLVFTLVGWAAAGLALPFGVASLREGLAALLGLIGWTANLWLLASVARRWWVGRWGGAPAPRVSTLALIGLGCAVAGGVSLYLSVFIISVAVGTWLWLAACGVVAASMLLWEKEPHPVPKPRRRPTDLPGEEWSGHAGQRQPWD